MYPLVIGNQSWQRTKYREMEVSMGKSVLNRGLFIAMFDNWMVRGILVLDLVYEIHINNQKIYIYLYIIYIHINSGLQSYLTLVIDGQKPTVYL